MEELPRRIETAGRSLYRAIMLAVTAAVLCAHPALAAGPKKTTAHPAKKAASHPAKKAAPVPAKKGSQKRPAPYYGGSRARASIKRPSSGTSSLADTQRAIIENARRSINLTMQAPTANAVLRQDTACGGAQLPGGIKDTMTQQLCARKDVGAMYYSEDQLIFKQGSENSIGRANNDGLVLRRDDRIFALVRAHDHLGREAVFDEFGRAQDKGRYNIPLDFERISSRFSKRRYHPILKRYVAHRGVDFVAPRGAPVWSTADGVVLEAGYDKRAGNIVKIEHANGYVSEYLHLGKILPYIKPGTRLARGQVIGTVGVTGLTTGPHLHFALFKDGKAVDPLMSPVMSLLSSGPARVVVAKKAPAKPRPNSAGSHLAANESKSRPGKAKS